MHRTQILAQPVEKLRHMAIEGEAPERLWSFLSARSFGHFWNQLRYLQEAFANPLFRFMLPSIPMSSETEAAWGSAIFEHRSAWEAITLPELMRLRDYFSFMQFARDEKVVVVVCGADAASGRWIGKPGVRCYGGRLPIPTSHTTPHDGLLAADPGDARLIALMGQFDPAITYADYVQHLGAQGLHVSPAHDGFLVKDEAGNCFHDSYRLHSVSSSRDRDNVWVQPRAEKLRAALNRHLGAELVLFGPYEQWEYRNDKKVAGPRWGPQPPAIEFTPNQEIRNRLSARDLAMHLEYSRHPRWTEVFPHHPVEGNR